MMMRWRKHLLMLMLMGAIMQIAYALWMPVKALLAQQLIGRAWQLQVQHGGEKKMNPWPWADTWPVAELRVGRHGIRQIVLAGDNGSTLAFGPGLSQAGSAPGQKGITLIGGHRDTHFRFLQDVERGDIIELAMPDASFTYHVYATKIIDASRERLNPVSPYDELVLVTCYPFDAVIPGGSERYLVFAVNEDQAAAFGDLAENDDSLSATGSFWQSGM